MTFNTKKCKVMHFGKNNPENVYEMYGQRLESVNEERDVGVMVHKSLKPAAQCSKAAATARAVLGQITRAFHFRDKYTFVKLYKTYVRPHLEFCTPAWAPWNQTDIDCLEKVQIKLVNMISGLKGITYEEKLKEIGLDSLVSRRKQADMLTVQKIVHGIGDLDSTVWLRIDQDRRQTRAGSDPLNVQRKPCNLELRRGFFSNRVIEDWNALPAEIKQISVTGKFKAAYKNAGQADPTRNSRTQR
jgi:hypothetical protein